MTVGLQQCSFAFQHEDDISNECNCYFGQRKLIFRPESTLGLSSPIPSFYSWGNWVPGNFPPCPPSSTSGHKTTDFLYHITVQVLISILPETLNSKFWNRLSRGPRLPVGQPTEQLSWSFKTPGLCGTPTHLPPVLSPFLCLASAVGFPVLIFW